MSYYNYNTHDAKSEADRRSVKLNPQRAGISKPSPVGEPSAPRPYVDSMTRWKLDAEYGKYLNARSLDGSGRYQVTGTSVPPTVHQVKAWLNVG